MPRKPTGRPNGRPSKLTPEVSAAIVGDVEVGCFIGPSAQRQGIAPETHRGWMIRGEAEKDDPKSPYAQHYHAIQKARASAENRDVKLIARAALRGDWKAAAWLLTRREPKRWRDTGAPNGPVHDPDHVNLDELEMLRELVRMNSDVIRDLLRDLEASSRHPGDAGA